MVKRKKPNLKKVLNRVDRMPEEMFGEIDLDLSTLPSLNKPEKEKVTANFDADVLEEVRRVADQHNASYTALINDVLRKVFLDRKKAG